MNQAINQVTTIAGNGQKGFRDGNALEAMFHGPCGICCSTDGRIYVADGENSGRIRMIYKNQVTTIAGNGQRGFKDGNALEAMFDNPNGICCSDDGSLYVADYLNHRIRMIHNNQVTTIAGNGQYGFKDGNALEAKFDFPVAVCCSNDGRVYVVDANNRIRMVCNNQVTTIAGNGQIGFKDGNALEAMFNDPWGICCSNDGRIYVADLRNNRVRIVYNNQVTTIADNSLKGPLAICCSKDGRIYIIDERIRMIYKNQVTTIAGNGQRGFKDGNALEAMFNCPVGICCSNDGRIYVTDAVDNRIRMIDNNQDDQQSSFGFALLLDMQSTFCDRQMSYNGITYHLHITLVNIRCPLLFDESYFNLIEQSNISNESFEAFLTFLYSNKLTKERNQTWPTTISIKTIVELIFIFDLLMNGNWILKGLKTRFTRALIEMLTINQQAQSIRELIVDVLPFMYNLKEVIKTRHVKTSKISYIQQCYNILLDELQKMRLIVAQYVADLQRHVTPEAFGIIVVDLMSATTATETIDDELIIVFAHELEELSRLAFHKTNISKMAKDTTIVPTSTKYLEEWTRPDFSIKLFSKDDHVVEYHLHKIVLCGRWKYFCQMIESGLKESTENRMTLTDDWNKSRFEKMMRYIYLNEIEFDEMDDIVWLMKNRRLYTITVAKSQEQNKSNINNNDQNNGINKSKLNENDEIAAIGFEQLYDHCLAVLRQPLTLSNCVSLYLMFEEIGEQSLVQEAFDFISANFLSLIRNKTSRDEMKRIEDKMIAKLMFTYFDNELA